MVSVIIPNYNHAQYLDERIQSVLNQTYKDFEVIILDDCSTDNSLEVINKYKNNPHVTQIVINEENHGSPYKQWYKGFKLAKGDLIWIAESDDTCEPQLLEVLTDAISKREDCVVAFCKIQAFDENGNKWVATPSELKEGIYESSDFLANFLSYGATIVNASGAIFKKNIAIIIDKEFTKFKAAGDVMFWTEMVECGSVVYVDTILDYFYQHAENSTARTWKQGINQCEGKKILDYIYLKGYINKHKYEKIKHKYIITKVLTIQDKQIKKKALRTWEPQIHKRTLIQIKKRKASLLWYLSHLWDRFSK